MRWALDLQQQQGAVETHIEEYSNHVLEAAYDGDELHLPCKAMARLVVPIPTRVTLTLPPGRHSARPVDGRPVTVWRAGAPVTCQLTIEDIVGRPLSVPLTVQVSGAIPTRVDSVNGAAGASLVLQQHGLYTVTAAFEGDGDYLPSQADGFVKIPKPTVLVISMPRLRPDIPRVWGTGDPLLTVITLKDADGLPVDRMVAVRGTGVSADAPLIGGAHELIVTYDTPQRVQFEVRFSGDEDYEESQGSAWVEVLVLRKEMVDMYQAFQGWAAAMLRDLPQNTTPRERCRALEKAVDAASSRAALTLTALFEEADYSEHAISIGHYADMLLAKRVLMPEERE
jgi:hypothetical protein